MEGVQLAKKRREIKKGDLLLEGGVPSRGTRFARKRGSDMGILGGGKRIIRSKGALEENKTHAGQGKKG